MAGERCVKKVKEGLDPEGSFKLTISYVASVVVTSYDDNKIFKPRITGYRGFYER